MKDAAVDALQIMQGLLYYGVRGALASRPVPGCQEVIDSRQARQPANGFDRCRIVLIDGHVSFYGDGIGREEHTLPGHPQADGARTVPGCVQYLQAAPLRFISCRWPVCPGIIQA
jgi:hypothetical protein